MTTTADSIYEPLTEETAIQLARRLQLFAAAADLVCREIGDGNLNLVFHVTEPAAGKGVIIKQALPYVRIIGEGWPLTLERARMESEALRIFARYAPEYVPEVYYTDNDYAITVMEDLSHLTIARTGLAEGAVYPLLSIHIGQYMARTLYGTSDYALGAEARRELALQFHNPELCKITENFVFTYPLIDHESNVVEEGLRPLAEQIWQDEQLLREGAKLKRHFMISAEALLHGDLHTGSIFASEEETRVIDPEFAFYGPMGYDIGLFIANTLLSALARSEDSREALLTHITTVWDVFAAEFTTLWQKDNQEPLAGAAGYLDDELLRIFQDAVGYAGSEMMRRVIGLAHARDIEAIRDDIRRLHIKSAAALLARDLIANRGHYKRAAQLVEALHQADRSEPFLHS
ncbi:S-methyl-5-thioribose kinase [Paenibacillus shenyangensis]|uniref:S-methyl-5-thioribose kinase n=1 Tax=Paenibacillus sp. A9 TaxID=1284352 RepID=UPI00037EF220|nr:S-methyl-5-thioribose kinase [Paenibacillus sp. A9]